MSVVLVDTSVWIDFLNNKPSKASLQLEHLIENKTAEIAICPIILQEILQGISSDVLFEKVKTNLERQIMLTYNPVLAAIHAAALYRKLRKAGITIRKSNDVLIAVHVLYFDVTLLHNDRDFELMAPVSHLKLYNFSSQ